MQNEELKPCPFCGGLARYNIWEQDEPGYKTSGWVVECPDCLCSTGIYSKSGAREAWNRRTIEAEPVRHGRWIEGCCELRCSACRWKYSDELPFMSTHGLDSMSEAFAYCPHCGARMDG